MCGHSRHDGHGRDRGDGGSGGGSGCRHRGRRRRWRARLWGRHLRVLGRGHSRGDHGLGGRGGRSCDGERSLHRGFARRLDCLLHLDHHIVKLIDETSVHQHHVRPGVDLLRGPSKLLDDRKQADPVLQNVVDDKLGVLVEGETHVCRPPGLGDLRRQIFQAFGFAAHLARLVLAVAPLVLEVHIAAVLQVLAEFRVLLYLCPAVCKGAILGDALVEGLLLRLGPAHASSRGFVLLLLPGLRIRHSLGCLNLLGLGCMVGLVRLGLLGVNHCLCVVGGCYRSCGCSMILLVLCHE
mmetsp:Transcript_33191/g.96123  ORF Transcript_33191/g.96123 Transcript_33191/m.96123 type:complete len:295 (-) Transcript_33191:316-1200(-)